MRSIRYKITAVTIAAILASVLALGVIGIVTIGVESDRSSVEKMSLISEKMQQKLNSYFGSIEQSVEMAIHIADDSLNDMSVRLFLSSRSPEQTEELNSFLSSHCAQVEHAFDSIANSTNGIVTYYYCINSDLGSDEHGFFWSRLGSGDFEKQPPLISTDLDINDIEHTTWYYSPIKAGSPIWAGPYKAHYLGEVLTISYVAPIYRYGFLIGVLGMDILFDTIVDQISNIRIYDTGHLYLMDSEGTIIYHPSIASGTKPGDYGQNLSPGLFRRSSSGSDLIRYKVNGQEKQLAFSTLRNKIKLGVIVPVSEINASQRRLTMIISLVSLLLLALFSIVTPFLMKALTRPLLNLSTAARRLVNGDYDVALDYDGKDEVGALTQSFRQMRDYLKLYISDLNSRVYYDALTEVKNRGAFVIAMGQLNQEINAGGRKKTPEFAFVSFDCNDLKHINDRFGHDRGDIYLQTASRLICQVFAHSPVFRLGGDEFGAILQNVDYQNRNALLAAFDQAAEEKNAKTENPWEKVSVARGMAVFEPGKDENAEQVVNRADQIMYRHKKQYR